MHYEKNKLYREDDCYLILQVISKLYHTYEVGEAVCNSSNILMQKNKRNKFLKAFTKVSKKTSQERKIQGLRDEETAKIEIENKKKSISSIQNKKVRR